MGQVSAKDEMEKKKEIDWKCEYGWKLGLRLGILSWIRFRKGFALELVLIFLIVDLKMMPCEEEKGAT